MEKNMSFESPEALASELKTFTENDSDIYRQQTTSILKNLATKKASGKYDRNKAVDLFMYLAESGARKYVKEFGGGLWHDVFPVPVRRLAAVEWRDEFETEYGYGNYDHLLPKKYQKSPAAKARQTKPTMTTTSQLKSYRDQIIQARGGASSAALIDQLIAGNESVRAQVETMLDDLDRDLPADDD
jgi:hypothetical protein